MGQDEPQPPGTRFGLVSSRHRLETFNPLLQSRVHCVKTLFGRFADHLQNQGNEDAGEILSLDKPGPGPIDRFESELMFAVKKPGNQQMPEPAQLCPGCEPRDPGLEGHTLAPRRRESYLNPLPHRHLAVERSHEGVPLRVSLKIGEDLPNPRRRGIDLDARFDGSQNQLLRPWWMSL